jgi:hypothetical protein
MKSAEPTPPRRLCLACSAAAPIEAKEHLRPRDDVANHEGFRRLWHTRSVIVTISRLEHMLCKLGAPMPFGGSQVLVGRRPNGQ